MHDHHRHAIFIIVFSAAAVFVLGWFLVLTPRLTGQVVVARGGLVTSLDISVDFQPGTWLGVYGDLTEDEENQTFALTGGRVIGLNLTYLDPITGDTVIVASTTATPDWYNLTPASHAEVDAFLGVGGGDAFSAENTLTELVNFTVNGIIYELWGASTLAVSGSYMTGALMSGDDLLLVTRPTAVGVGFSGLPVEYQLLLPAAGETNFTFFVFEQDSPPVPGGNGTCDNITFVAYLAEDNESVTLDWDPVFGAVSYELLYVDGPTNGQLDFSSPFIVPMGAATKWTDSNPADQRYYRVRIWDGAGFCVPEATAGTIVLDLSPDQNLVSTPFFAVNESLPSVFTSIDGEYSTVFEYDNEEKIYRFYAIIGNNIFKNFDTIKPGRGYWIEVGGDAGLRLAGLVVDAVDEPLSPDNNLVGFTAISNSDGNESLPYVLGSIDGEYSTVFEYDNEEKIYRFYAIIGNNIFKNFDTIKPGRGYWIEVGSDVNLTYANG